jgi:predicted permease
VNAIAVALVPILALILLGFVLRSWNFVPQSTWAGIEKITYFVLFPALLVHSLGSQRFEGTAWPAMLLVVVGTLLAAALALIAWHRVRQVASGPTFTSIFQGGIRFNTFIALAVAQGFFGAAGLALAAVAAGFLIVLINLMCIGAFSVWGARDGVARQSLFRQVAANPLILGCVAGGALGISGIGVPGVLDDILEIVGRAALPLGLLAVGAALRPRAVRGHAGAIAVASLVQFALKPLVAVGLAGAVGLEDVAAGVLIIAFMTPTASSGYILARQLGGDTETMASIITFQTLLAFAAMPAIALLVLSGSS